jgi:hypothetical protein
MQPLFLSLAVLLAADVVCGQVPVTTPTQTIPVPEASGAVNIGQDRVIVIADEGYDVRIVTKAAATFKSGDPKVFAANMQPAAPPLTLRDSKKILNDIEDVAWDEKTQSIFVITSHSLNTSNEEKPARYRLARLSFINGILAVENAIDVDFLKEAFKQQFPFIADAMKRPHPDGGASGTFNIEGLAFDPNSGSLLIGLRSPTQMKGDKPCAVVIMLKNPHEVFLKDHSPPAFEPKLRLLDLGGLGIRGMTYDPGRKGFWIVAGRSDDPAISTHPSPVPSSVWFWDPRKASDSPQMVPIDLPGFVNLEGVCLLTMDGRPGLLLFSDDGDEKNSDVSRYVWLASPNPTQGRRSRNRRDQR